MEEQLSVTKVNNNKRVKWDQQALKESQKNRGKYQKIIQPKTPYNQCSNHDEDMQVEGVQKSQEQKQLEQNLTRAQNNRTKNRHDKLNLAQLNAKLKQQIGKMQMQGNGFDDEQTQQEKQKKEDFKKKRNAHYNQFKMIQQMKNKNWEDSDGEN